MSQFHIFCNLPNAALTISGLAFEAVTEPEPGVRTVEPVEAATAARFKGIPGYQILDAAVKETAAERRAREAREVKDREAAEAAEKNRLLVEQAEAEAAAQRQRDAAKPKP